MMSTHVLYVYVRTHVHKACSHTHTHTHTQIAPVQAIINDTNPLWRCLDYTELS